jgi:16S rRNA (cytosine1402-N4)-methyltransferase
MTVWAHKTVLEREAVAGLAPHADGWWVDATVGAGGHAEALLKATAPGGRVLGFDQDAEALAIARERLRPFHERLVLVQENYSQLRQVGEALGIQCIAGIILDLGVSSMQLDEARRGFAFKASGPLDMRMDARQKLSAADLVNHAPEEELKKIFQVFGEERYSGRAAHWIVRQRPFRTTTDLAAALQRCLPKQGRIHPATRIFQALRIAVNDELRHLEKALALSRTYLAPGGRCAVISFHSLEDRLVKEAFRHPGWERINKKVVVPGAEEIASNPRARSAKLRIAAARPEGISGVHNA